MNKDLLLVAAVRPQPVVPDDLPVIGWACGSSLPLQGNITRPRRRTPKDRVSGPGCWGGGRMA